MIKKYKKLSSSSFSLATIIMGLFFGIVYVVYGTTIGNDISTANLTVSGNVGVGTSTPATLFTVATTTNIFNVLSSGKVGIGTINPLYKLSIEKGNMNFVNIASPSTPLTATLGASGFLTGDYLYKVVFVTSEGQTNASDYSNEVSPVNQQINLSNIPISPDSAVIARKIYRTLNTGLSGVILKLLATINNNTTTTYIDNVLDINLGSNIISENSTGGVFYLNGSIFLMANDTVTKLGYNAGPNFSGSDSVIIGKNAGSGKLSTSIAIGNNALSNVITSDGTIAIGHSAMQNNTEGVNSIAIGSNALKFNTIGSKNIAIGDSALSDNITGSDNISIGEHALHNLGNGSDNVVIGPYALNSANSPEIRQYNVSIGSRSMYAAQTAIGNVAIGNQALISATNNNYNVAIGDGAASSFIEGADNVFLGKNAGNNASQLTTVNNSMALGMGAYTTANNQVVIGNSSVTQTLLKGNVGIVTTTPSSTLHISGNVQFSASSTITTAAIGGSALAAGACVSTNTTIDSTVSSSTAAFVATPQIYPGDGSYWYSYLSAAGTLTTKVCAVVSITPVSSAYNVKIIK